jgi:hypothetical protein
MVTSLSPAKSAADEAPLLSNREALARLIDYARVEAEREGETACADLLFAAFVALEAPLSQTELWATLSGLGQRRPC